MTLPHINSIGFTCSNLEATTNFFCQGLGFQTQGEPKELRGGTYVDFLGLNVAVLRIQRLDIGAETQIGRAHV